MINHVRTLLLNRSREGHTLLEAGEEYIPADYVPHALSQELALIHTTLFGSRPDRLFLNYRMRQIMQLMHATPLATDISNDDPRITYLPFKPDLFDAAFKVSVLPLNAATFRPHITGEHLANMSLGICQQCWDVTVETGRVVTVTKRRGSLETAQFTQDKPVPLIGSKLTAFLQTADVGYSAQITSTARPTTDIAAVLTNAMTTLGETGLTAIFPLTAPEPVATWKRVWESHPTSIMKFAAMLLAIAYRTSQMPQEVLNG